MKTEEIKDLIWTEYSAIVNEADDIWLVSGMSGDDWHEFIDLYARAYHVDMQKYKWYYHGDEEPYFNIGALFYPPPQNQVNRIPLSLEDLVYIANKGEWDVSYPDDIVDLRRKDLIVNRIVGLTLLSLITMILLLKLI